MKFIKINFAVTLIFVFCSIMFAQTNAPTFGKLDEYPLVPASLMKTEILLTDNKTKVKLEDYKDRFIILSFIEAWATPARKEMDILSNLSAKYQNSLQIIAVSQENETRSRASFRAYAKSKKIRFQTGWIDENFANGFIKISRFVGVPQSFLIKDGRLHGIFTGAGEHVNQEFLKLVGETVKE